MIGADPMPVKVHYEDNLFFLHTMVRTIESGMKLDIDPEYFRDKILEDIFFIDAALLRIYSSLKENSLLVNRSGYMRSLRRTIHAFVDFLKKILDGEIQHDKLADTYHAKLSTSLHTHERVQTELESSLERSDVYEESSDTISSQEYGFLLAGGEEDVDT